VQKYPPDQTRNKELKEMSYKMNKLTFGALALFFLTGCTQEPAKESLVEPHSGIDVANFDTSIKPGDDFFTYVNGRWIAETEIPPDKSSYGGFTLLRDDALADVKAIIEMSATGHFAKDTDEQKVGDLYKSYMNMDTRNALGADPLGPELDRIAAISSYDDLAAYFGWTNRRGFDAPFGLAQFADMKNPGFYGIYAFQSGLGLPEREYYFADVARSVELREKYLVHVEKMFSLAGLENAGAAATTIMALETRLADKQMKKEETRDWSVNYNKVAASDLSSIMPRFNWDAFFTETGFAKPEGLIVIMTDYMVALDDIIRDIDLDTWKTYLNWVILNTAAASLSDDLDKQNFDFYGKTLRGTEEQEEPWRRAVRTVNRNLGEVVGKVYVKKHFPPEAKERMLALVANLIAAYEKSIGELDWMGEETKAQALEKLSKFTPKIGYPDTWRDYSAIGIEADDLFGNLERAALADHQRHVDRQGGPVDRGEWGMTPQTVNAYYSPTMNEIVFPAAILQPPFFDLDAENAVNYGAIGAIIGHEIGHGFDDSGSTFDGNGELRNWWTDEDRAEFEQRTSKLVEQYSAFAPFDDLNVNGEYTLGENIGDLGGITIGLLAYKMSLQGEESPVLDGFTGVQRVFLGFAQVWRNKYRDEALRLLIGTNRHSPSMYRTNGAVRNVSEFYETFDVSETDALYLPPEERVKIW
jgi:putative endopeptidase